MRYERLVVLALFACTVLLSDSEPARANAPFNRYTITTYPAGNTVLDTRTGRTWQQTSFWQQLGYSLTLTEATSYCAGLALAGGGWRLPTIDELLSLVDDTRIYPAIDTTAFPNTPGTAGNSEAGFWTSTPSSAVDGSIGCPSSNSCNWCVAFAAGGHYFFPPATLRNVRCVR